MNKLRWPLVLCDGLIDINRAELFKEVASKGYIPQPCRVGDGVDIGVAFGPIVWDAQGWLNQDKVTHLIFYVGSCQSRYKPSLAFTDEYDAVFIYI